MRHVGLLLNIEVNAELSRELVIDPDTFPQAEVVLQALQPQEPQDVSFVVPLLPLLPCHLAVASVGNTKQGVSFLTQ